MSPWNASLEYSAKLYTSGGTWGFEVKTGETAVGSASGISEGTHDISTLVYPGIAVSGGAVRVTNVEASNE